MGRCFRPGAPARTAHGARWLLPIAGGFAACSGNVATSSDASTSSTHALLTVERTLNASDNVSSAHAAAYFLRVQAGADQVAATLLVNEPPRLPAEGQCEAVEVLSEPGIPLASLGPIELVDVGEVVVQAAHTQATLATRAFPNVVDLISGVVYTTRDRATEPLPDRGAYTFRVSGSAALAGMTLDAQAPGGVEDLTVGGMSLGGEAVSLPRGDVVITWQPQASGDVLYAELTSSEDGPLERLRCALGKGGLATIPAALLPKASAQNLAVHLLHREALTGLGIDSGEARFDLATTAAIRFDAALP